MKLSPSVHPLLHFQGSPQRVLKHPLGTPSRTYDVFGLSDSGIIVSRLFSGVTRNYLPYGPPIGTHMFFELMGTGATLQEYLSVVGFEEWTRIEASYRAAEPSPR